MKKRNNAWVFGMVVCLLVTGAFGQMQVGSQGRALDASSQAGSGGYNTRVPSNYMKNTNMSSLNESRGLSGFHGKVSDLSGNFQGRISTDGVSRFMRQSVGVSTLSSPQKLYDPKDTYYVDPSRAVLRTGQILQAEGRGEVPRPGHTNPPSSVMRSKAYVNAMADYAPIMPQQNRLATAGQALTSQETRKISPMRNYVRPDSDLAKKVELDHIIQRGGDSLYGIMHSDDRRDIAKEIREFDEDMPAYNQPIRPLETLQQQGLEAESRFGKPIEGRGELNRESDTTGKGLENRRIVASQTSTWHTRPIENQDSYMELLVALRGRRDAEKRKKAIDSEGKDAEKTKPEEDAPATLTPPGYKKNVELTKDNQIIIHKLSGKSFDVFSQYMNRAKESLGKGLYYQASRQYDLASIAKSQDPMPYIGGCLAYFGAGEWKSSARKLSVALKLFPPLVETRLDLPEFLSNDDIKANFAELESWIEKTGRKPALILLGTYISHNLGDKTKAQKYATMLKEEKSVPPVYHAFADYVLTGKRPAEMLKKNKQKALGNPGAPGGNRGSIQ
jgi:hypothetical protein